ncbi:MAG: TrkH family potassium uptake protein [Candidatus Aminicenantales bacterium]
MRRGSIRKERRFPPAQVLAISFALAILVGAFFLWLPFSTTSGHISAVDAIFTATSAVCVTGLIVQDTPTYFSPVGHVIILILIQLGGLGIITFSTLILLVAGKAISIKDRLVVQNGFVPTVHRDVRSLIKDIFLYTIIIEIAGAVSLFIRFLKDFPPDRALSLSGFHAVSAFCNAGFSLFSQSFVPYREDVWLNVTVILLIVLGGLGFLVQKESVTCLFYSFKRKKVRMSLHSKLVLSMTLIFILFSFLLFFLMEQNHALKGYSFKGKMLASLFQTVTPRTAGFNTIDLTTIGTASVLLLLLLMLVGASPGSTGGGVKTSTIGVIFAFLRAKISARDSVHLFYRTIPSDTTVKAFTLFSLALSLIFFSSFLLLWNQPELTMKEAVFEVFSAFGTVGLSLGTTFKLNTVGKVVIIVTMYMGRVGLLTLLYAFTRFKAHGKYAYVEESVMIG